MSTFLHHCRKRINRRQHFSSVVHHPPIRNIHVTSRNQVLCRDSVTAVPTPPSLVVAVRECHHQTPIYISRLGGSNLIYRMAHSRSVASVPNSLVVACGCCAVGSSRGVVYVLIFLLSLVYSARLLLLALCRRAVYVKRIPHIRARFAERRGNSQVRKEFL